MKRFEFVTLAIVLFALAFTGAGCGGGGDDYSNPNALVSANELEKMIAGGKVTIIDARGSVRYNIGHIPGAINISVAHLDVGDYMMFPSAAGFASAMSDSGIKNDDLVVLYDDVGGHQAGRLAWMFMQFGHSTVALLDGGWSAWTGSISTEAHTKAPSSFTAKGDGKLVSSMDDVLAALGKSEFVILDTRAPGEFTGETVLSGAGKGGRIPGAVLIDWVDNMDENTILKSAKDLKSLYKAKGVTPDKKIITYCHAGYRASFTAFVLKELLGFPNVFMYDGSWLEWSNTDAPFEK